MARKALYFFGVIALSSLVYLVGCGVPKRTYEKVLSEKADLQAQVDELSNKVGSLEGRLVALVTERDELLKKVNDQMSEMETLKGDNNRLLEIGRSLRLDYETLIVERNNLMSRVTELEAVLKKETEELTKP